MVPTISSVILTGISSSMFFDDIFISILKTPCEGQEINKSRAIDITPVTEGI